jgi:hypothetical protein
MCFVLWILFFILLASAVHRGPQPEMIFAILFALAMAWGLSTGEMWPLIAFFILMGIMICISWCRR